MKRKWFYSVGLLLISLQNEARPRSPIANATVAEHNSYRSKIGIPQLAWSDNLAARAQQWAATLIERGAFEHRRDGRYSESLFEMTGGNATPASVLAAWMSEEADYHRQTNSCKERCGHYTQVIWRSTKLVGCGVASSANREVWVCNYDPPGNVVGERP